MSNTCNATSLPKRLEQSIVTGPAEIECRLVEQRSHVAPRDISCPPTELLAKIFSEGPHEVRRGTLPSIVTVSHVLRHWRVVSIGPGPPHQFDYLSSALRSGRLSYPGLRALTLHGHWRWLEYRVESDGTVVYDEDDNWYYYDELCP
ncbi:hypothetical protein PLICRDRAFT_181235 [Plicaturopsis crispa FD-325 SS-3]|uniref:F-box domain-containing protein n=1 Tax=Plicaturopsis crispa FD-325 SS-3 TaxID=944288 RepID=A0A0C9T0J6_PLICR|nr:hypothetical protein PLICRDRAFT_181235 [Plicaturopsis crispa FD-325 SS-3]